MYADLDRLLAAIPRHEVAVQWDVAMEFSLLEEFFGPIGPEGVDAIIANLARCVDAVPAEVPAGLHLCYGDWGQCRHGGGPVRGHQGASGRSWPCVLALQLAL